MRLKTYCANNNALIPLKFRKLITCLLNAQIYQFTVLRVYGKIYQISLFTIRNWHAQIVNLRFYRFTGRSSGTMESTILRFYCFTAYRFTARLGKRRALNLRLAHRHHSSMFHLLKWSFQPSLGHFKNVRTGLLETPKQRRH